MLFRSLRLVPAAVVLATGVASAAAQEINATGIVRSYSLFAVLGEVCGRHYAVDAKRLQDYKNTFEAVGVEALGRAAYGRAITAELDRRRLEVSRDGERTWCDRQRADLLARGAQDLFRDAS